MKNKLLLFSLGFLLLVGACKKEDVQTCPEPDVPYQSVKTYGDTASMIKVIILNKEAEDSECTGTFMWVVGHDSMADPDFGVNFYKITNSLPDSVMDNTNYGNTEWLVNVKYLGVGLKCYVLAFLIDPKPGEEVPIDNVELVEITHIEPFL